MSIQLPINSASPKVSENKYRLYIQYKSKDIKYSREKLFPLIGRKFVLIYTTCLPVQTSIRPCSQSIKEALEDLGTENVLKIAIDGGTQPELKQLLKIYTSLEYRNEVTYLKEMKFDHQYDIKAIRQVIKPRGGVVSTLVLGYRSFSFGFTRSLTFRGSPTPSSKYTLQVKFEKRSIYNSVVVNPVEKLSFSKVPFSVSILEQDDSAINNGRVPTIELFIKSDNLSSLVKIKNDFMNLELPSEKIECNCFEVLFKQSCLATMLKSPQTDKYSVYIGEYKSHIQTFLHYPGFK